MKPFLAFACAATLSFAAEPADIVIADFESGTYDGWDVTGTVFGAAPAKGSSPSKCGLRGWSQIGQRRLS